MFQIRLVQTIFSIEIGTIGLLQLKSVLISFDINTFHFSLHINELNTVENSSQESNPVPTSILILAGRGSLRRCSGSFSLGHPTIMLRWPLTYTKTHHKRNARMGQDPRLGPYRVAMIKTGGVSAPLGYTSV